MFSFPHAKTQRNAKFKTPYLNILASQNIVDTSLHSILKSSHLGVSVTWCLGDFLLGVPAIAVGLSAISLLAPFPSRFSKSDLGTSTSSVTSFPSPNLVPDFARKGCRSNP